AHAALAGKADTIGEVSRAVIMSACQHQSIDAPCPLPGNDSVSRQGIAASRGKEKTSMGELRAGHRQRAVVEIEAEHMFDRMFKPAESAHEISERDVAIAGGELRFRNGRIDRNHLVVREMLDETDDFTDRLARRMPGQD